MALIARRKLVQLREDAVDEVDLPSFATRLEGHCRSLGCAISRGQQPHIRLRQRHGPERQARPCKRVQSRTASSPFASMTFATVPQNVCSTGTYCRGHITYRCGTVARPEAYLQAARTYTKSKYRTSHWHQQMSPRSQQPLMLPR